jgi:hypothetical protein
MPRNVLRGLKWIGAIVGCGLIALVGFVAFACARFDASLDKVYDVAVPVMVRSTDPAILARGKHLVSSVAPCAASLCHGSDLSGGRPIEMGPVGTLVGPNITSASLGAAYSDGELARLIKHGIKKDGRSVKFMPVQDFGWLPDSDVAAVVSYLRTLPGVDRTGEATVIRPLGKVLDRQDQFIMDVARRIDHAKSYAVPEPAPTAEYGAFLGRLCTGCHGERLSGGRIPGSPPSIPTPLNLTSDATGLRDWTFEDFVRLMRTAQRKNGKPLDPFMPVESWRNFDDVELEALWRYLQSVPSQPFGHR